MSPWRLNITVSIICCFLFIHVQSDVIPDPVNFEVIPPDREELREYFQLVLRAINNLEAKVDRHVGDLEAKLSLVEGTLIRLDCKIEAISVSLQPVELISHATEAIRTDTGEALEKLSVIEDVVVRVGSALGNMSSGVEALKDQVGVLARHVVTPLEVGISNIPVILVGNARDGSIGSVVNGTTGRLYTGANFTGGVYNYDLKTSESNYDGCISLPSSAQTVGSVYHQNGCIRLFKSIDCHDLSLAFYPGSENSQHLLSSNFSTVQSLGPCLANEFEFSTVYLNSSSGSVFLRKSPLKDIPDMALIGTYYVYDSDANAKTLGSNTNPVTKYLVDSVYRIKYFRAVVYDRHFTQTPEISQMKSSAVWRSLEKKDADGLGFVIPLNMSGPGNKPYNVFPQSKSNELDWGKVLSRIRPFVKGSSSNHVYVYVNFVYPDEVSNRPNGFYYFLITSQSGMKPKISYGFIRN